MARCERKIESFASACGQVEQVTHAADVGPSPTYDAYRRSIGQTVYINKA